MSNFMKHELFQKKEIMNFCARLLDNFQSFQNIDFQMVIRANTHIHTHFSEGTRLSSSVPQVTGQISRYIIKGSRNVHNSLDSVPV